MFRLLSAGAATPLFKGLLILYSSTQQLSHQHGKANLTTRFIVIKKERIQSPEMLLSHVPSALRQTWFPVHSEYSWSLAQLIPFRVFGWQRLSLPRWKDRNNAQQLVNKARERGITSKLLCCLLHMQIPQTDTACQTRPPTRHKAGLSAFVRLSAIVSS